MIDPKSVCLFQPSELKKFKAELFQRIGNRVSEKGGKVIVGNVGQLRALPKDVIPIIGCSSYLRDLVNEWRTKGRRFIYWDRGYYFRVFATWLPRGENGGMYRWHLNSFQQQEVRDCPDDRLKALRPPVRDWNVKGRHIVVAQPTPSYAKFHGIEGWTDRTLDALSLLTDRQIVIRGKESKRPLSADLQGAHCLVAHGSNAAVESVIMGCPVFVDPSSAASLIGRTDLKDIESPVYPDREAWLRALSYSQFNETELVDGTLWRLLE